MRLGSFFMHIFVLRLTLVVLISREDDHIS